jgi:hypothetical protein
MMLKKASFDTSDVGSYLSVNIKSIRCHKTVGARLAALQLIDCHTIHHQMRASAPKTVIGFI